MQEQPAEHPSRVELLIREGPRWPVGSPVDVVVRLDYGTRTGLLLRVTGQTIHGPQ